TLQAENQHGAQLDFSGLVQGLVINANQVTIDGFDIVGNATTRFGVYIRGAATGRADVSVLNNKIHGMAANVGAGYAIGILADANVNNTTFGENSGLVITGNEISSIGDGVIQGAGMSLHELVGAAAGEGALVSGNNIHSLNGAAAVAIQIGDAGIGYTNNSSSGVEIIDNVIDAPAGVVAYALSSTIGVGTGSFGAATRLLVLNLGEHSTVDEGSLGQFAKTDQPTPAGQFGLLDSSVGYTRTAQDAISNSAVGATVTLTGHTFAESLLISQ